MSFLVDIAKSTFSPSSSESPCYEVLKAFENGIEERRYQGQKWAVVESEIEKGQHDSKTKDMFWALFGYITGKNEKEQKISMTVPVSTKVEPRSPGDETASYQMKFCQMGFYVPQQFQQNTPQPTDPRVKIVERDLHIYSITFGGYLTEAVAKTKLHELLEFLKTKGLPVATQGDGKDPIHYTVGYDAPQKFWNRKNEIWVPAA